MNIWNSNLGVIDLNVFKTCFQFVQNITKHKDIFDKDLIEIFQKKKKILLNQIKN